MCMMTEQRVRAGERFRTALAEMRTAAAELAVFDHILQKPGFKSTPDVISWRHETFAPLMRMESFSNDVQAARAARSQ
jgi:hypothetical protein